MVDPKNVLEAISPMLDSNGGIKELSHVSRIVGFMRDNATKMASRCVYLLILSSTKNKDILKTFIKTDGWSILSNWLEESISEENFPLIQELLGVFAVLPVDVDVLKSSKCPKSLAKLSKSTDKRYAEVSKSSKTIVTMWKNAILATQKQTKQSDDKTPLSASNSLKMEDDSNSNQIDELQDAVDTISKPIVPPSIMQTTGSSKPKATTVKAYPIKFRQTGLEAPSAAPAKRTSVQDDTSAQKRAKIGSTSNPPNVFDAISSHVGAANLPAVPPAAAKKPVPPPKVVEFRESSGFMDALNTASIPVTRAPPPATIGLMSATQAAQTAAASTSPTSGTGSIGLIRRKKRVIPAPGAATENRTSTPPGEPAQPSPPSHSPGPLANAPHMKNGKRSVWWPDDAAKLCRVKYFEVENEPIMHGKQHGDAMKKAEMQMDRGALQKAKQLDRMMELQDEQDDKNSSFSSRSPGYSPGSSSPGSTWKRLIPLDLPENIAEIQNQLGRDSKEKFVQADHQLRVLEVVYFIRRDIPDSPAEPNPSDLFADTATVMKSIPLEIIPDQPETAASMSPFGSNVDPSTAQPLPGPLSSMLAAITGTQPSSTPPQPMDIAPAAPTSIPPPPPGMPFMIPPFPSADGSMVPPPPFGFDPNMPFPPMPPGPDGAVPPIPPPPFPPPPGMFPGFPPFPFPPTNSGTIPPFPGPFPPPPVSHPPPAPQQASNLPPTHGNPSDPPVIVPVGTGSSVAEQQQPPQQNGTRDFHHNNFNNYRPPVSIRFPAGIPSKVPFGVCRYFYESGTCPRQNYCKFKHIQRQLDNVDRQVKSALADEGGDSPHFQQQQQQVRAPVATSVAVGRR